MIKYTLTRKAEEDLIQIYLFGLQVFGPSQAEIYHESLEKTFIRIAENPEMYRPFLLPSILNCSSVLCSEGI
nr:hypothetical protein [Cytophagales bacterium]